MSDEQEINANAEIVVIKPINEDAVHRICSGQVVLSLAIAVKELVENAIDAGATNVAVRLQEYGSELIEVCDNGTGVPKENFQALTLKHYTSKLREFGDLESVGTLGFRGEALSSLCALSDLSVTTRHVTAEHGTKIAYNRDGKIVSESPAARSCGTTVSLSNLFCSLPVRRKEFLKNLKKEFNKMCQLLHAYCLVSTGVKLTCTNQTSKGPKATVVSTQGLNSVRDNIISVFGSKQISSLIDINVTEPDASILEEHGLKMAPGEKVPFEFECFVSSVMHGSGRSSSDRQFYYVNSRPCEPTKVMKVVNETYRQFNCNQYPFVYLNVLVEKRHVDVNVTPDKRQIFLEKEKLLLAAVRSSLLDAFKNFPSTYRMQNLNVTNAASSANQTSKRSLSDRAGNSTDRIDLFESFKKKSKVEGASQQDGVEAAMSEASHSKLGKKRGSLLGNEDLNVTIESIINAPQLNETLDAVISGCELGRNSGVEIVKSCDATSDSTSLNEPMEVLDVSGCKLRKEPDVEAVVDFDIFNREVGLKRAGVELNNKEIMPESDGIVQEIVPEEVEIEPKGQKIKKAESTIVDVHLKTDADIRKVKLERLHASTKPNSDTRNTSIVTVDTSVEEIKRMLDACRLDEHENDGVFVRFRSQISPAGNQQAEQELQKQIMKDDFRKMDVIGQFNLGFIIARLEDDLFIIDQHASDEKYNFEQLQLSTVLESQVLVSPKPLELTAGSESLLIENEEIFKKNGFSFAIDHLAEATKKVKLASIPISKNVIFGKDDIDELLFMLQGASHTMCRPSRVRTMFASRACRKSVMVGDPLTLGDMKKLVEHMGEIDQPWNCPHGRPTMRHLINLNLIHKN